MLVSTLHTQISTRKKLEFAIYVKDLPKANKGRRLGLWRRRADDHNSTYTKLPGHFIHDPTLLEPLEEDLCSEAVLATPF